MVDPHVSNDRRSTSDAPLRLTPYRADIQGLRAVAVLLVVASHLHVSRLAGGYIGVDVFFVISGYLISSKIIPQIVSGTFSLLDFYQRRIRRIFPALIVLLAATLPLAWHFLFAGEMLAYARSLLAAVFACSNMLLWSWGGYFDKANELKPLLHTWSLGVEEQFYLMFPLLLLGIARLRKPGLIRVAILAVAATSFGCACILVYPYPHAAFFNIALRAWELMLGAILSQHYVPPLRGGLARNVAGAGGLLCILLPAIFYTANTVFPGLAAFPPCLGAALIIAAGETGNSLPKRLLSLRPFVFFGLISYSLYLWHWPIQVFANLRHMQTCAPLACGAPAAVASQIWIFALSVAVATLSWRFVETPFREGAQRFSGRRVALAGGLAAGLVATSAGVLIHTQGAPFRYSPEVVLAASQLDFDTYAPWRWGSCSLGLDHTSFEVYDQPLCLPFTPGKRHYLLLGDSHAAHLWPGMSAVFPDLEIGQANVAGCNLMPDKSEDGNPTCRRMAEFIYDDLLNSKRVDTLIVSALWTRSDLPAIGRLASYARERHIEIILIGPSVAYDLALPRLLANLAVACADPMGAQAHINPNLTSLDAQMATLARDEWKVRYVSYFGDLCATEAGCPAYAAGGVPILLDSNHFTPAGAIRFSQAMRDLHQIP
jgi:peptidoglycan/LPS O-acetylase OafA/YrhL